MYTGQKLDFFQCISKKFNAASKNKSTLKILHSVAKSANCHGLNSIDLTSTLSILPELSAAARYSAYLPLYW